MGGTTTEGTKTSTQTSTPWDPAAPALSGILGNVTQINPNLTTTETNALDRLSANASAGNPFAPAISGVANTLLGGGGPDRSGMANDAYQKYLGATNATAGGQFLDPNSNPFFGTTTNDITDKVVDRLKSTWAGAGRDPAGAGGFGGNVAGEVATALAPMYSNAYNSERDRQMAAITGQFGAGSQMAGLLSGLDQTKLGNQQAGITAADAANTAQSWGPMQELAIEAQRRGIPLQTLAQQMGLVLPAAQAFGSKSGTETSESTQGTNWGQLAVGAATAAAIF